MRIQTLPILIALAGTALQAQAADDRLYVAPTVNYTFSDNDRRADDGWGGGLALGKPITQHLNMELSLTGSSLDYKTGSGNYDLWTLGVDALYLFNRDADFTPYGVLGIGAMYSDIPGKHDTGMTGNIGLGIMKRLTDNISLRADARYRMDGNSTNAFGANNFGDAIISVGLNFALGQKAQPKPKPEPMPEPMPVVQPAPAPEPEPTPAPAPAPAPMPAAPALTTPQAMQLDQAKSGDVVVILEGVNFEFDSARLRPDAITILDEAVTVLNRRSDISVDVVGHTDSTGTMQYNQGLSERRAKSVYDYFVSKGIAADRLTTKGYGETKPIASNATREGRAKNRRVELVVK
jgi:OOP family OmpA-OmpF porin